QVCCAIAITIAGFYYDISTTEWLFQIAFIGLVMSLEGVNTAIEKIMDLVHPEYDIRVRDIKDLAAGAVLFTVLIALTTASFIYLPKIYSCILTLG
ncbi:MAG: diacylglycerol kinase family protein, partial [Minisyncoccia bacterium]